MTASSAAPARHVIFHTLSDATAALAAAEQSSAQVALRTARGAVRYAGPTYLIEIVRSASAECANRFEIESSAFIDCRDEPALVYTALRAGWRGILYNGPKHYQNEVKAAAAGYRAKLLSRAPRALDLLDHPDSVSACLKWYAR